MQNISLMTLDQCKRFPAPAFDADAMRSLLKGLSITMKWAAALTC
jgi:hypothetical protein